MIDIEELHKPRNTILKNQKYKTDAQALRYLDAIQHKKAVINYKELLSLNIEDVKIVKKLKIYIRNTGKTSWPYRSKES